MTDFILSDQAFRPELADRSPASVSCRAVFIGRLLMRSGGAAQLQRGSGCYMQGLRGGIGGIPHGIEVVDDLFAA